MRSYANLARQSVIRPDQRLALGMPEPTHISKSLLLGVDGAHTDAS